MAKDSLIDKYITEVKVNKGFILTCNKCSSVANIVKNNTIRPKSKIGLYVDAEEDADTGSSVGWVEINCGKCSQAIVFDKP